MPKETQYYVPKLQAVKNIVADPGKYGVVLPPIDNAPSFHRGAQDARYRRRDRGEAGRDEGRGFPRAESCVQSAGDSGRRRRRAAAVARRPRSSGFRRIWPRGNRPASHSRAGRRTRPTPSDTLASVAKRVGISEEQLREANQIPPRYRLASGSTILIPRDETMESDIPADSLDGRFALVPEHANLRKVTYRVRRGDTVTSVAQPLESASEGCDHLEPADVAKLVRRPAARIDGAARRKLRSRTSKNSGPHNATSLTTTSSYRSRAGSQAVVLEIG